MNFTVLHAVNTDVIMLMACWDHTCDYRTQIRLSACGPPNRRTFLFAESALGHVLADKVEAAYPRRNLFERRTKLMDAWTRYCASPDKAT